MYYVQWCTFSFFGRLPLFKKTTDNVNVGKCALWRIKYTLFGKCKQQITVHKYCYICTMVLRFCVIKNYILYTLQEGCKPRFFWLFISYFKCSFFTFLCECFIKIVIIRYEKYFFYDFWLKQKSWHWKGVTKYDRIGFNYF